MCLDLYAAAPLQYRGLLVHINDLDGFMFVNTPTGQLRADDWPSLKAKIDEELSDVH